MVRLALSLALVLLGGWGAAKAQNYPARTVTVIVPFAPGAAYTCNWVGEFACIKTSGVV